MKKLLENPFGALSPSKGEPMFDEENPFEEPIAAPPPKKSTKKSTSTNALVYNADPEVPPTRAKTLTLPTFASLTGNATPQSQAERDLAAREAALKAREAKMAEMEKKLEKREAEVTKLEGQAKNWPIKGRFAIAYHSITDDIPSQNQRFVRHFYLFVRFFWIVLLYNFITISVLAFSSNTGISILDFLFSALYLIAGVYGSFHFWYYPIYRACRTSGGRTAWFRFWIGYAAHMLFTLFASIGYIAAGGIMTLLKATGASGLPLGLCFICTIVWGFTMLFSIIQMKRAHSKWKEGGGNVNDMKGAVAGEVFKSQFSLG